VEHVKPVNDPLAKSAVLLTFEFTAMASPCSIKVAAADAASAGKAAQAAIDEVHRIESKYSRYIAGSVVGTINAAAGRSPVAVDEETAALLQFAETLYDQSDGLFDITSGVLRQAWDFKRGVRPTLKQLGEVLPLVGWDKVEFAGGSIRLPILGMELDFGGFGKEYAADRAGATLQNHGVTHALINLGGDVRAIGPQPGGEPWLIGIAHPRRDREVIAQIPLASGGLATSGDYERYFELDGRRYCHILNPRTGQPVSYWQSISVVGALAVSAGSLSTIAMLQGAQALPFLGNQGVAYLAIDADGNRSFQHLTAL
jgi:thiamine biosynthesis lipoprotein